MAVATIHAWIVARGPYEQGVDLLKAQGDVDDALLFLLELGETSYSREKLTQALQVFVDQQVDATRHVYDDQPEERAVTKADIAKEREQAARDPATDGYDRVELPPALAAVRAQIGPLMKEMAWHHSRLETMDTDADRLKSARIIVANDAQVHKLYARLDAWTATGRDIGAAAEESGMSPVEMDRKYRSLVTQLSPARIKARGTSPEKVAAWEKERDELKAQLDAL